MGEAVIVSACRTAIGTARKGTLLDVSAFDLAKYAVAESLKRSGVSASDVDDIVLGEVLQGGGDIARYAAIETGLIDVPGVVHNRHCASGMAAVQTAAGSIMAGMDTVVIAGGAESISTSPSSMKRVMGTDEMKPWMSPSHPETPQAPAFDMSITVGWNTAQKVGVTREEMDHWAYESHMRAVRATEEGRFEEEIFPIDVELRDGTTKTFSVDEHPRATTTMEKLGSLKPLHPEIDGFSITAGNSSGLNDGSAAMVIVDGDYAKEHGLEPLAIDSFVGVGGTAARGHGHGTDVCHPEGAEARGPVDRRHRALRDQRGLRIDVCRVDASARYPARDHQRQRERLQPRPPGRLHRCPHDRDGHSRAPSPQRWLRRGEHVRRRRYGIRDRHRSPQALTHACHQVLMGRNHRKVSSQPIRTQDRAEVE